LEGESPAAQAHRRHHDMVLALDELVRRLDPSKTVLVLGAGAAVPSGAPSGVELSHRLATSLVGELISDDLAEASSILERRVGRDRLVAAVRAELRGLSPSGGLEALPHLQWPELFTTNFDLLLETAYRRAGRPLVPVRSNYEYERPEVEEGTALYKIHGCVTKDVSDGQRSGMVLTERDYDHYAAYRETLFKRLELALLTKSVLIVGQSLRDPHLRRTTREAAAIQREAGGTGRTYLLLFERDEDRAALVETAGLTVTFGDIDGLVFHLAQKTHDESKADEGPAAVSLLPIRLLSSTIDVSHARALAPNPVRLFHGAPATYADIANGLTFTRDIEGRVLDSIRSGKLLTTVVLGVAGVGKTTVARRVLQRLQSEGFECWEHRPEYPFLRLAWQEVEARLRAAGRRGVLLIDDCPKFLSQVNKFVDSLGRDASDSAIHLVVSAQSAEWRPRIKSPIFFSLSSSEELSTLSGAEIDTLLTLMRDESRIGALVDRAFGKRSHHDQVEILRRRCQADMFVCLKNIFANESLDAILLREFAALSVSHQDIYRHVAYLEATGARVHRQLVLRLLNLEADTVAAILALMAGIVDEFDIDVDQGLYGWSSRHPVIAETIARYKYADDAERKGLLTRVIEAANPSVRLERELLREICGREFGIGSLLEPTDREALLRKVIARAPSERVPRHRLLAHLLDQRAFDTAEQELQLARDEVGWDPPLARYEVRIAVQRATDTVGILDEDRRAILLDAERRARRALDTFPEDKYAYKSFLDVGVEYARLTNDPHVLEAAYLRMRDAYDALLDPEMAKTLQGAYSELRKYGF
jgi:hypothetical protein